MYNDCKVKVVKKCAEEEEDNAIEAKIKVANKVQEEVQIEKVLDEQ
jgi:hypothetical protein